MTQGDDSEKKENKRKNNALLRPTINLSVEDVENKLLKDKQNVKNLRPVASRTV